MAAPNPQLEAALQQFAHQPGVTPQQIAELRSAVTGSPTLLRDLNADAAQGHLNGFALSPPGPPSIGRYDVAGRTIHLPPEVFTGAAPANSDLRASLRLQDMSLRFAQVPSVTTDMVENLQRTINESPALVERFKEAVRSESTSSRHLMSFDLHTQGVAGGSYNPNTRSMNLVPSSLAGGTFDQHNMSFVLGHEMEHGFNRVRSQQARATFDGQARQIASDVNPINDYTAPSLALLQANRRDEAEAHIAGWNAMLSHEKQRSGNPNAGLQEMWNNANRGRVADFLELDAGNHPVAKAGLAFSADGTLPSTQANVAAMGRHYFDQPPAGTPGMPAQDTMSLGPHGHSDYANNYGAGIVARAIWFERTVAVPKHGGASRMHLNLHQLGVNEKLMEENGIYIVPNSTASQAYFDTSTHPPTAGRFDHTFDGPNKHQHLPVDAPGQAAKQAPGFPHDVSASSQTPAPAAPNTMDEHPILLQSQAAVDRLDRSLGRTPDEASARMSASLARLACESGLTRIDHVVLSRRTDTAPEGENVFVVQGRLDDPAHLTAHMKTTTATQTPVQESLQRLYEVDRTMAQQAQSVSQEPQSQAESQRRSMTM